MAKRPKSQATHCLPSFSATAAVVPLPQKQSRMRSPSLEDALIIRSSRASGFWVAYFVSSLACEFPRQISVQKHFIDLPCCSSRYLLYLGVPLLFRTIFPSSHNLSIFSCVQAQCLPGGGSMSFPKKYLATPCPAALI